MASAGDIGEFTRRDRIVDAIEKALLDDSVVELVLPSGSPLNHEPEFWDYKESAPMKTQMKLGADAQKERDLKIAELIKDVAAFYNSYGGYLIIGVSDEPRTIVGFAGEVDVGEVNVQFKKATSVAIQVHFKSLACPGLKGVKIGLLYIPRRPAEQLPVTFQRSAPEGPNGRRAYKAHDIYFRRSEECVSARDIEDFAFLLGPRVASAGRSLESTNYTDNNLPARDPTLVKFIGREAQLDELWRWLLDRFNPVKIIAGIGGMGKTTLARHFAETVGAARPSQIDRIIWLTAKPQHFSVALDDVRPNSHIDFSDFDSLVRAVLLNLGHVEDDVPDDLSREERMQLLEGAFTMFRALLVVDDVDALPEHEQNGLFHDLIAVAHRCVARGGVSRILLTSRLNLGAAPAQLLQIEGLDYDEFADFVDTVAGSLKLGWKQNPSSDLMKRFHRVTDGCPIFAASVVRLVSLGDTLEAALHQWTGSDGESVRRFALERELKSLRDRALRTLFGLCILGDCTLAELEAITGTSTPNLRDDVAELRKFQMLSVVSELPTGGPRLSIPQSIRVMKDVIEGLVHDPRAIERACKLLRSGAKGQVKDVGKGIFTVISLLQTGKNVDALKNARFMAQKFEQNADVHCLLGRVHLKQSPPDAKSAELAFRRAAGLGCTRSELVPLWVEAKRLLEDWVGIIELTDPLVPDAEATILAVRSEAMLAHGDAARARGEHTAALDSYERGAREIDDAFRSQHARGAVEVLTRLRNEMGVRYLEMVVMVASGPVGDLDVWYAARRCYEWRVRNLSVCTRGLMALQRILGRLDRVRTEDLTRIARSRAIVEEMLRVAEHAGELGGIDREALLENMDSVARFA